MRLYEFSKENNISSKELLEVLQEAGFHLKNHMSALSDDALSFLQKRYNSAPKSMNPVIKPEIQVAAPEESQEVPQLSQSQKEEPISKSPISDGPKIIISEMTVEELAHKLKKPITDVILSLLRQGVMATKNQVVSEKIVADLARHYDIEAVMPSKNEHKIGKHVYKNKKGKDRLPVVVVAGHVDHGKTTLLDFIRKTRVVSREKGGITQHLGAYQVKTKHGGLVFLDTPGHEAFTQVRLRGAKAADVMVLVVAADDSAKPQTIEAIKHAEIMQIPIIVAVNKMDKVAPERVDVVKRDLSQYKLLPEEWGGETVFVPISAKEGTGVDNLLEVLLLQSDMMELKADSDTFAHGFVLESKLEKGRGSVATIICQQGTIHCGDYFICGSTQGKVITMTDSFGKQVRKAGPSIPVQITGFEQLPDVGEVFQAVPEKEYRKARSSKRDRGTSSMLQRVSDGVSTINLIIKTDGNASREALLNAIRPLSKKSDKKFHIIHSGVGGINESDILLAANTNSCLIGFNVKVETNAAQLANKQEISIKKFDVIYHIIDALKDILEKTREVVMIKKQVGEIEVRKIFDIKGVGVVAGCYVKDGKVTRDSFVNIERDNYKIGSGSIRSLQRDKRPMKEVSAGYECAFLVDGFSEWQVGDKVKSFIEVKQDPAS